MIALLLSAVLLYVYHRFVERCTETMLIQTAVLVALLTPIAQAWVGQWSLGVSVVVSAIVVVIVSLRGES